MINDEVRRGLARRLSRIEGQARGIKKMVDDGQDAAAVLVQLMALQKATRAAATEVVKAQAVAQIETRIRTALEACPGPCDHCDELLAVQEALAALDLDALLDAHLKVSE